jgi:hypothetical protein
MGVGVGNEGKNVGIVAHGISAILLHSECASMPPHTKYLDHIIGHDQDRMGHRHNCTLLVTARGKPPVWRIQIGALGPPAAWAACTRVVCKQRWPLRV